MKVKSESDVAQSYLTLSDPMDCSLPGSSVHGIFQARVLEWVASAFSKVRVKDVLKSHSCSQNLVITNKHASIQVLSLSLFQFSSVQSLSCVPLFATS